MQIGVVFPNESIPSDANDIRAFACEAEHLGFDHLLIYDHVLGAEHSHRKPPLAGSYTEADPFHEPLTLMSFLAGCTEHLELATGVLVLGQRQTALVAKQVAEVDLLSSGRIRLGVGAGWNYVEYESLGIPWQRRGRRIEEQVIVMRELWDNPVVDFTGEFHRIDRAGILPRPSQSIPIWFGGFSPSQQERAARLGDGFIWQYPSSWTTKGIQRIRDLARDFGRDPERMGFDVLLRAEKKQLPIELAHWVAAGGTHSSLLLDGASDPISELRELATIVQPFRGRI
jgi:probable F420-dependent oxidoreductase